MLDQVYDELSDKVYASGDSVTGDRKTFEKFLSELKAVSDTVAYPFRMELMGFLHR